MATLAEIMREQEDERIARQLYSQHTTKVAKQHEQLYNYDDLDDETVWAMIQAQVELEAAATVSAAQKDIDDATLIARLKQEEEDSEFALELQGEEKRKLSQAHMKQFTPLEEKLYKMKISVDDSYDEEDEEYAEDEEEEELFDESGNILDPRVHDRHQRQEDEELAFVYRRDPEKTQNKIQQGGIIPLHHQEFRSRNTGKSEKPDLSSKHRRQMTSLQFRPKSFEHEEYGMVVESLGGNKVKVLCMDGHVRLSSIMGKLQKTQWIKPGHFVLVKVRPYQQDRADIVLRYVAAEFTQLLSMGELNVADIYSKVQEHQQLKIVREMIMLNTPSIYRELDCLLVESVDTTEQPSEETLPVTSQTAH